MGIFFLTKMLIEKHSTLHVRSLDGKNYQIVSVMIKQHTTMKILGLNQFLNENL